MTTANQTATCAPTGIIPELGQLTAFGLTEPWHRALLLPTSFEDFTAIHEDATYFGVGHKVLIRARPMGRPTVTKGKVVRSSLRFELADGTVVRATWFGDTRELMTRMPPGRLSALSGTLKIFDGGWEMSSPTLIPDEWIGRVAPVYAGKVRSLGSDQVRDSVAAGLEASLPIAARHLRTRLDPWAGEDCALAGARGFSTFLGTLRAAHMPDSVRQGEFALAVMDRLAAALILLESQPAPNATARAPLALSTQRTNSLRFKPTADQLAAIETLASLFRRPQAEQALMSGDVGSGKSGPYMVMAAAVADAGGRAAIMLPGESLARQMHETWSTTFPDIPAVLVTGATKGASADAPVAIGTTALLHRKGPGLDLLVVDEQQKMGADARRALCDAGTHLLEVSATPVPRTMALLKFGGMTRVHLRNGHSKKQITTTLWPPNGDGVLRKGFQQTIAAGERMLIVYPAVDVVKNAAQGENSSIEATREKWEAILPGKVRVLTGRMTADDVEQGLKALCDGSASVGIVTSVVEVGINIPNLRRVVVIGPENFGLTSLHQLRGRLAREGGHGAFDLVPQRVLPEKSARRLQVMVETNDGMEVALADMRERGPGDLWKNGKKQSGKLESLLPGRTVTVDTLEGGALWVARWAHEKAAAEKAAAA